MKKKQVLNVFFWIMLGFYLFLLWWVVLSREGIDMNSVNLIPFKSIAEGINIHDGIRYRLIDNQVWGNVVIFIPAGIYLMLLGKEKMIARTCLIVFLISLGIEVIQYVFRLGVSDIDDIILNCLGGGLGIMIYCLLEKLAKSKERIKQVIAILSLCVGIPLLIIVVLTIIVNYT